MDGPGVSDSRGNSLRALQQQLDAAEDRDALKAPMQTLARRASEGEDAAVDLLLALIDRRKLAHPAIARQLFNPADQDDVAQDVLLAVARSIGDFRGDANVLSWLHRIATNSALGFVRRRRDEVALGSTQPASESVRFTSIVTDQATVREAILGLPGHYRQAVTLRDIEQLPYAEVAARLGLNLNTARAHIARGRVLVAERLGGQMPGMTA